MKSLTIQKSGKKSFLYLILSVALLIYFIYLFATDHSQYSKGKSFYWIGIALVGAMACYFIYDSTDIRPLYILNEKGIYSRHTRRMVLWSDISFFECKTINSRYITHRQATLFDRNGDKISIIDVTHSDLELDQLERVLKKKLKQKPE